MRQALLLAATMFLTSCHALFGNPDASLNGGAFWADRVPNPPRGADSTRVWLRMRSRDVSSDRVAVLRARVRQALADEGWRVVADRLDADVWFDIDLRFLGPNPRLDLGRSAYEKVLQDTRPDLLEPGERPQRGRMGKYSFLTPGGALISAWTADVREHALVADVRVRDPDGLEERQTLVLYVRKIEMEESEAAAAISDGLVDQLRTVFPRRS